jgi:hypothetical protein
VSGYLFRAGDRDVGEENAAGKEAVSLLPQVSDNSRNPTTRQQHSGAVPTLDQLDHLEGYQCRKCCKALSRSFKGIDNYIPPSKSEGRSKKSSDLCVVSVSSVA